MKKNEVSIIIIPFVSIIFILSLGLVLAGIIWSDPSDVEFTLISRYSSNFSCYYNSTTSLWYEYNNEEGEISSVNSFYNCSRNEEINNNLVTCCPSYYICNLTTNKCELEQNLEEGCKKYKTKNDCENYDEDVAEEDVEILKEKGNNFCNVVYTISGCQNSTYCFCYWNTTKNKCDSGWNTERSCDPGNSGYCYYNTIIENKCNTTGYIEIGWTANWTGSSSSSPECQGGEQRIKCLSTAILPFFSIATIIILILLIVIYYLLKKKKKRKINKNRRIKIKK
ncbi:MAG: hypothetical protein QW117_01905 [Candidatus Pacearchaeota archaeon]